ncbi:MAG: Flp pilus assembly complex ATPase component TadA [Candidatus Hydrogenedentes bacterium]|nr:Flp pilus assembly complex ATPase component TadA [Candidatus Hydrogenedentota bacterium]
MPVKEAIRKSLIGEALVKEGILTEAQLTRALRIQALLEQPKMLGEVLVDLGFATKKAVSDAIIKHGGGMRLGDLLVEQGLISPESLDTALGIQRDSGGKRLGDILINLGAINERTLLQNLASQARIPYIEPEFGMIEPRLISGVSPDFLERNEFVPFSRGEDGRIVVVVPDLENEARVHALHDLYRAECQMALGPRDSILATIQDFRRFRQGRQGKPVDSVEAATDSVAQLVDHILARAIEERASDIHIEPMSEKIRVRYRIDGVLVYKTDLPKDLGPRLVSRIKIMAECNIAERQQHQGGRILHTVDGHETDLRLSVYVTVYGECIVIRVLNKKMGLVSLDGLGMTPGMLERYRNDVLDVPTGVVLITGPTGSGKTTTLYSSLDYCNKIDIKIITVEDPVEYLIEGLVQCTVHEKAGRTFDSSLREIVRQDPDIIVLGEIRDQLTARTAIQAALTGHKVYSTFHTEDTIGGLLRLVDMDIETFLISSTVISIVAQRLLRRVCDHCVAPSAATPRDASRLGLDFNQLREYELKRGRGCNHCNHTGYYGRVAAYELLILNEDVKDAILRKKTSHEVRKISMDTTGLISMREDGIAKVLRGLTTFDEVLKSTPRTPGMRPLRQILSMTK